MVAKRNRSISGDKFIHCAIDQLGPFIFGNQEIRKVGKTYTDMDRSLIHIGDIPKDTFGAF